LSATQEQIEKLKMDGISTIETEKKISTIKMLEAYGKESKNEVIDAITRIIDSSPRTEVVKAGHDSIQRMCVDKIKYNYHYAYDVTLFLFSLVSHLSLS
jgi:uncharacterized protein (DUF1499 family)